MRGVGLLCCLLGLACGAERATELAAATELAQPHVRSFSEIERWMQRVVEPEGAPRTREALSEMLFAQVRGEPSVLAVWVDLRTDREIQLSLRGESNVPPLFEAVTLRDPRLGALRVGTLARCPLAVVPKRKRVGGPCVILSRAGGSVGRGFQLTVAFAREALALRAGRS